MELETSFNLMNGSFNKKRKRIFPVKPGNFVEHETEDQLERSQIFENDEEDDKEFEILEETKIDGNVIKKVQNKNSHKIRITEERVSDALRDLQIEMDTESRAPTKNRPLFKLSNELKSSMETIEREQRFLTDRLLKGAGKSDVQKMQIISWIPNKLELNSFPNGSHDDEVTKLKGDVESDCCVKQPDKMLNYQVEEPYDKKNLLKRKYSLMNTILIGEIKPNEKTPVENNSRYIVELDPDEDLQHVQESLSNYSSGNKSSVNITEVNDDESTLDQTERSATKQTVLTEEEQMEL